MLSRRELLAAAVAATTRHDPRVDFVRVPDGGMQPQAVVSDNVLHLIYLTGGPKQADVVYRRSNDFGRTFSEPMRVNSQPGTAIASGTIRGAQLAVGKGGRVHVAWNASDGSAMFYTRLNDAFEPQRNMMRGTVGLDGGGSVAADAAGNVYVAWHGKKREAPEGEAGRQVWIAKSTDDGKTFEPENAAWSRATGACGCCGMKIFAARDGHVYAMYRSATESIHRDIYLLDSKDQARSFEGRMLDRWNINACPMSSMAITDTLLGWETEQQVYFSERPAGSRVIEPEGPRVKRKYPALVQNGRGETLFAWVEGSGFQKGGTLGWQIFSRDGKAIARNSQSEALPAFTFVAAIARPDGTFALIG